MVDTEAFEGLLLRAKSGTEQDWEIIDSVLQWNKNPRLLSLVFVRRAVYELLGDENEHVRNFAMAVLCRSPEQLDDAMAGTVRDSMIHDKSEVVRLRAAVALYGRSSKDHTVLSLWAKAAERLDAVGADARRYAVKQ